MNASLSRVILNVHDVKRLSAFYQHVFALSAVERIKSETSDFQNSGVPEFWHFTWTQIGNIRFACSSPRAGFWGACF
jgi:hypothetical protein